VLEEVLAVNARRAGTVERKSPPHIPADAARWIDHEVDWRPAVALVESGAEVERETPRVSEGGYTPPVGWR